MFIFNFGFKKRFKKGSFYYEDEYNKKKQKLKSVGEVLEKLEYLSVGIVGGV